MELNKVYDKPNSNAVIKIENKPLKEELIYLGWENISVWTPDTTSCIDKIKKKPKESKQILKNGKFAMPSIKLILKINQLLNGKSEWYCKTGPIDGYHGKFQITN